jgi:hypothetical protein
MKTVIGIALTAAALFIWGFVFWIFIIPDSAMQEVADNAATQQVLAEHFPTQGMYFVPGGDPDDPVWAELHEKGPIAMVSVTAGRPPQEPMLFIKGIVVEIALAALIAWMLALAAPSLPGYTQRVIFVCIAGLGATLLTHGRGMVWFGATAEWVIPTAAFDFVSWLIAGLILARFIRPVGQ